MARNTGHMLFISHKANRSGAPVLLLEIIKALALQPGFSCQIICMEDGELVDEFKKLGTTFTWQRRPVNHSTGPFTKLVHRFQQVIRGLFILWRIKRPVVVFYNTIVNGYIQKKLSFLSARSICYVHELEAAIHMLTNQKGRQYVFERTNFFLSVSMAVKHNLVTKHHVDSNLIHVVASPLDETLRDKQQYASYISQFKERYQLQETTIIGIVANNEWRKGFDLLMPLATLYYQLFPNAATCFVWKGFREDHYTAYFDLYDYDKCRYKDKLLLLPHGSDSIAQMACFDIHLLLSREDPYPLVVLEAATLGVPTVCFKEAGGAAEFVEADCGYTVPYGDLGTMVHKLHALVQDQQLRKEMGNNCRQKVMSRHDKQTALTTITSIINDVAKSA